MVHNRLDPEHRERVCLACTPTPAQLSEVSRWLPAASTGGVTLVDMKDVRSLMDNKCHPCHSNQRGRVGPAAVELGSTGGLPLAVFDPLHDEHGRCCR